MTTVQKSDSTDSIALIIEVLFGIFGALGIGWLYAGNVSMGVVALIGYLVFLFLEGIAIALTGGLAACVVVPVNLAIIVISGFKARDYVRNTGARGNFAYVVLALIVPFVLVCGSLAALTIAAPTIDSIFNDIVRELGVTPVP
jgi:hypothetical protein